MKMARLDQGVLKDIEITVSFSSSQSASTTSKRIKHTIQHMYTDTY